MKISPNRFLNLQANTNTKDKVAPSSLQNTSANRASSRDEIIIRGKIEKPEQNSFVDELKNKISKEVAVPASEKKLADLKQQIEEGTYQIDIDRIAKKILLKDS